jgi:hypothetical protein
VTACYIDAFSGLAGDMMVGALADAGADQTAITRSLESLAPGAAIEWARVKRRGISATKFRVAVNEPQKHRHLSGILKMIRAMDAPERAKATAERIFQALGAAEATVHDIDIEKVHFHEVGAVDSICDIVGAALALDQLGVESVHCSAVNVGSGTVSTEHGILPVPAPATARLLLGRPIYSRGPALELTTPTGAAIPAALAVSFGPMPAMRIDAAGYGAGDFDFAEHANVVRVMIGELTQAAENVTVAVIEANIDDSSPQVIAYAVERLLAAGALDAVVIPVQMKKGRPGVILQIVAEPTQRDTLAALVFRETTTLGLRFYTAERRVEPREWVPVTTMHGVVRVKTSPSGFAPEYEDARRLAEACGVPLKQILSETAHEYLKGK